MDCVFCQIIAGKLPCYKVYEDDLFLAFLDIRPLTLGNTLVVPKKHYRWVDDVPEFGEYFKVAKKVGLGAKKAFNAKWICYLTLGLEVFHAHIRVIPRYQKDLHDIVPDLEKFEKYSDKKMKAIASLLTQSVK